MKYIGTRRQRRAPARLPQTAATPRRNTAPTRKYGRFDIQYIHAAIKPAEVAKRLPRPDVKPAFLRIARRQLHHARRQRNEKSQHREDPHHQASRSRRRRRRRPAHAQHGDDVEQRQIAQAAARVSVLRSPPRHPSQPRANRRRFSHARFPQIREHRHRRVPPIHPDHASPRMRARPAQIHARHRRPRRQPLRTTYKAAGIPPEKYVRPSAPPSARYPAAPAPAPRPLPLSRFEQNRPSDFSASRRTSSRRVSQVPCANVYGTYCANTLIVCCPVRHHAAIVHALKIQLAPQRLRQLAPPRRRISRLPLLPSSAAH